MEENYFELVIGLVESMMAATVFEKLYCCRNIILVYETLA